MCVCVWTDLQATFVRLPEPVEFPNELPIQKSPCLFNQLQGLFEGKIWYLKYPPQVVLNKTWPSRRGKSSSKQKTDKNTLDLASCRIVDGWNSDLHPSTNHGINDRRGKSFQVPTLSNDKENVSKTHRGQQGLLLRNAPTGFAGPPKFADTSIFKTRLL